MKKNAVYSGHIYHNLALCDGPYKIGDHQFTQKHTITVSLTDFHTVFILVLCKLAEMIVLLPDTVSTQSKLI